MGSRIAENYVNPFYYSEEQENPLAEELIRLRDSRNAVSISKVPKELDFDGDGKNEKLSAEEYDEYTRISGETRGNVLADVITGDTYKSMTDKEKQKIGNYVENYASEVAKIGAYESRGEEYDAPSWVEEAMASGDPAKYITANRGFNIASDKKRGRDYTAIEETLNVYETLPKSEQQALAESTQLDALSKARKAGVSAETWYRAKDAYAAATAEQPDYTAMDKFLGEYGDMSAQARKALDESGTWANLYKAKQAGVSSKTWYEAKAAHSAATAEEPDYAAMDKFLKVYGGMSEKARKTLDESGTWASVYKANKAGVTTEKWYAAKNAYSAATDAIHPTYTEMDEFMRTYMPMSEEQRKTLSNNSSLAKIHEAHRNGIKAERWFEVSTAANAAGDKNYQKLQKALEVTHGREVDVLVPQFFESNSLYPQRYQIAREHGYSPEELVGFYEIYSTTESDRDANGESLGNVRKKVISALVADGWSSDDANKMYNLFKADRTKLNDWSW